MEDPALSKNFVDAAALRRYNFFKGLILVLLAALLLSLWGFTRQFASIQAPTLNGPVGAVSPGSLTLNGRGTPNSDIDVQMDGQSMGMTTVDADGNWSLDTDLTVGSYDFIARALDPDGVERGRSGGLTVTVAEPIVYTAPTLTLPAGDVDMASVPFSGTGTPGSMVELFNNGVSVGTAVVGPDGKWSLNVSIIQYMNEVEAFGFDPDGGEIGSSGTQPFTLKAAAAGLTLNAPDLGEFSLGEAGLPQATFGLKGTGEPNSQIQLAIGDLDLGTTDVNVNGIWSFDGDLALAPGEYNWQARMLSAGGEELGMAELEGLVVPALGMTPTFSAETDGDGNLVWKGRALPGSPVEIIVNGQVVDTVMADAGGNWSWVPDLELGEYEVSVRSADDPNLTSDMQMVRVGLPVMIGTANVVELDDGLGELTLRGTAVPESEIEILINGEAVDTVTADADGNWVYAATLPNGSYAINGRYQDLSEEQAVQMAASQTVTIGQPAGALQLLFAGSSAASEGQPGTAPAGSPVVEIILDASGSMMNPLGDSTRFESARTALQNITENVLPDGTPIAVRAFGNIEGNFSCRTDLMIPYQPLDRETMNAFLANVEPQVDANTPIADSLARVPLDLADVGDLERIVVLLTDGEETCGGDPAAQIQNLRDAGIDVQVNIVGLAIADDALKAEFERWAEIGGGQYFDVSDPGRLLEVLGEAVLVPYVVRDEAGNVVTIGRVGGQVQSVPVGTYTVEVRTLPAVTLSMVEIVEGETLQLTLDE